MERNGQYHVFRERWLSEGAVGIICKDLARSPQAGGSFEDEDKTPEMSWE